ncbi:hypothetical protein PCE1_000028 [Barthelona sp. PCE]
MLSRHSSNVRATVGSRNSNSFMAPARRAKKISVKSSQRRLKVSESAVDMCCTFVRNECGFIISTSPFSTTNIPFYSSVKEKMGLYSFLKRAFRLSEMCLGQIIHGMLLLKRLLAFGRFSINADNFQVIISVVLCITGKLLSDAPLDAKSWCYIGRVLHLSDFLQMERRALQIIQFHVLFTLEELESLAQHLYSV